MTALDITRLQHDGTEVSTVNALPVSDASDQAGQGATAYTVGGATIAAGRAIVIDCTAAGTCTLQFADSSTLTLHLQANQLYVFNFAIIAVTAQTATATYTRIS